MAIPVIGIPQDIREGAAVAAEVGFGAIGEAQDQVIGLTQALVQSTRTWQEWGTLGYENMIKVSTTLGALSKAIGYIPIVGKITSEQLAELKKGFEALSNATENEKLLLEGLSDLMVGKFGKAFNNYAGILVKAAGSAQTFQIELLRMGQNTEVIAGLRAQANVLSQMGISYIDLKDSSKSVIENFRGSIRLTQEQTRSFERNRYAIQEQVAFNKKFDVSNEDSIKILNLYNDTTNNGVNNFEKLSSGLEKFAMETGQKTKKVFEDFTASMDRFAFKSAPDAISAFAKLEAFAKRTGQETKSVINSLAEFDDFSSGYEKIGKLNRVLMQFGASIDPMMFMNASDEERQRMLVEGMSQASTGFGGLQTERAKRLVATSLSELSKIPFESTVGLLSGVSGTKNELLAALEKGATAEKFTKPEKIAIGKELTTSEDARKLRDALYETTDSVQKLAAGMRESDFKKIGQIGGILQKLDPTVFNAIVDRNFDKLGDAAKGMLQKTGDAIAEIIRDPSIGFGNAVDRYIDFVEREVTYTPIQYNTMNQPQNAPVLTRNQRNRNRSGQSPIAR